MRRELKLYIEGLEVDQFQDTEITITSSVQNVADISKVFTDLTQSFTIPASPRNNQLFQHYYENDVSFRQQEALDFNLRRSAVIEIDTITYRTGKVGIEKANVKNGMPYSYQITFYGDLVSMKDILGEEVLSDLNWSAFDSPYSFNDVVDRVEIDDTINNYDVRYPLISSSRLWQYNNPSTPTENINTNSGAIHYTELFPALRIEHVLQTIENYFNIQFVSSFRSDARWLNAWMLFKNKIVQTFITPPEILQIDSATDGSTTIGLNATLTTLQPDGNDLVIVNTYSSSSENYIRFFYATYVYLGWTLDAGTHNVRFFVTASNPTVKYYFDVFRNGILFATLEQTGSQTVIVYSELNDNNPSLDTSLTFKVRSDFPMTFNISWEYEWFPQGVLATIVTGTFLPVTTTSSLSLKTYAPNIKIIDWIQSIVKMFNMTIVPITPTKYILETLETWYGSGEIYDITKYTDVTSIDVARIKLYKNVSFKYQQSESLINRAFQGSFIRNYGDLTAPFPYDGGEYKIEVPFEDMLMSNIDGFSTCVGYALNSSLQPYENKPIILYKVTAVPTFIKFHDGSSHRTIHRYEAFTADGFYNNNYWSLNWGAEISPLYAAINFNSLYATYYQAYIQNLFNRKNRLTTITAKLPLYILTNLSLNDRLIIRDKRYIINDFSVNLATGEAKLTLLNDFRRILALEDTNIFITLPHIENTTQHLVLFQLRTTSAIISWDTESRFYIDGTPPSDMPIELRSTTNIDITADLNRTGEDLSATLKIELQNNDGTITTQYVYITQEFL